MPAAIAATTQYLHSHPRARVLDAGANSILERRIERDHEQPIVFVAIARRDGARQPAPHGLGQQQRILVARGVFAERLQNRPQLANRANESGLAPFCFGGFW